MTGVAFPFLRLPDDAVTAGSWLVARAGDAPEVLGASIAHWDYATDLVLMRVLEVDFDRASAALGISAEELRLMLTVSVGTGFRGLRDRRVMFTAEIDRGQNGADISFTAVGDELSESLVITTELLLAAQPGARSGLSPVRPGSRLWSGQTLVELEPAGPRFPMEGARFSEVLPDQAGALFYLEGGRELDRDFSGALRLLINADNEEVFARITAADGPVLQLLMGQVLSQLTRRAITHPTFGAAAAEPGSLRAVVEDWLQLAFPGQPLASVRALLERDPARFEAAFSALASSQLAQS